MTISIEVILDSIRNEHFKYKTNDSLANIRFPCGICHKSVMNNQKPLNVIPVENGFT